MRKVIIGLLVLAALVLLAAVASGQTPATTSTTTVTKTVQNPDGTYTIIEYPVGKSVTLTLDPIALAGASGTATVLRDPTTTTIKLRLTGMPADMSTLNVYAVDPEGVATLLGPIELKGGAGDFSTATTLDKFMIIASPEASLATYVPETKIIFRSAVPEGFAVVPLTRHPVGEKVAATAVSVPIVTTPEVTVPVVTAPEVTAPVVTAPVVTAPIVVAPVVTAPVVETAGYNVPMLNIPGYSRGHETELKVSFNGAMTGARANVILLPRKDGPTEIAFRFHELKEAPAGKVFMLWAVSPDNKFIKLGQVVNVHGRNESEIKSEIALPDFGLLVTMEDANDVTAPIGPRLGIVGTIKSN